MLPRRAIASSFPLTAGAFELVSFYRYDWLVILMTTPLLFGASAGTLQAPLWPLQATTAKSGYGSPIIWTTGSALRAWGVTEWGDGWKMWPFRLHLDSDCLQRHWDSHNSNTRWWWVLVLGIRGTVSSRLVSPIWDGATDSIYYKVVRLSGLQDDTSGWWKLLKLNF